MIIHHWRADGAYDRCRHCGHMRWVVSGARRISRVPLYRAWDAKGLIVWSRSRPPCKPKDRSK